MILITSVLCITKFTDYWGRSRKWPSELGWLRRGLRCRQWDDHAHSHAFNGYQKMASVEENPETLGGWGHTYKHVLKLEVVGDTVVGKSSLVLKFTQGKFREQYLPTLGEFLYAEIAMGGVSEYYCRIPSIFLHVLAITQRESQFKYNVYITCCKNRLSTLAWILGSPSLPASTFWG